MAYCPQNKYDINITHYENILRLREKKEGREGNRKKVRKEDKICGSSKHSG
jgi:hypothetical protein